MCAFKLNFFNRYVHLRLFGHIRLAGHLISGIICAINRLSGIDRIAFIRNGGIEYNVVLAAAHLALIYLLCDSDFYDLYAGRIFEKKVWWSVGHAHEPMFHIIFRSHHIIIATVGPDCLIKFCLIHSLGR